tara:strand:- start:731 stop:865 length:135 start_codon:yes stop_codon:yes gene_type:complete
MNVKLKLNESDLAPKAERLRPGLQDLDLWTNQELIDFIVKHHLD